METVDLNGPASDAAKNIIQKALNNTALYLSTATVKNVNGLIPLAIQHLTVALSEEILIFKNFRITVARSTYDEVSRPGVTRHMMSNTFRNPIMMTKKGVVIFWMY